VGADHRAAADARAVVHDGRRVHRRRPRIDGEQQRRLGHQLGPHEGGGLDDGQTRAGALEGELEPQLVAGDDAAAELAAVDAAQRHPRRRQPGGFEDQRRGSLRQRLDLQHRRHERHAGKVPLEILLADGDLLHRDDAAAGLVLDDGVDEARGIAVEVARLERREIGSRGGVSRCHVVTKNGRATGNAGSRRR
jgi:hypothetical protein